MTSLLECNLSAPEVVIEVAIAIAMVIAKTLITRSALIRGHLMCTNRRAQADKQKIARNEGVLVLPSMHLCMCSMLVPSEFSPICKKRSANRLLLHFPGTSCISESAKKLQKLFGSALFVSRVLLKLFGSALSHVLICPFFDVGPGDCWGGFPDAEMAFRLCTFVGAHQAPSYLSGTV